MNSFKKNIIRQIFITNDAENEHFSSLNNELKKKNNSETNPLNRPGSAPFRYYSPSAKSINYLFSLLKVKTSGN